MEIIEKNKIPLKYLKDICKIMSKSWDYMIPNRSRPVYWLSIVIAAFNRTNRKHNTVYLALNNNKKCIGFLLAKVTGKPGQFHPIHYLLYIICCFLLSFSKDGRYILAWRKMYHWHESTAVRLGKQALLGKNYKKISEGLTVAILPEYRKSGTYREMNLQLMQKIDGFFVFPTSTECVYQAHEAMGFKKLFAVPYFYPEKDTTFIMYGEELKLVQAPSN
jgi:hypothetical protein